MNLLQTIFIDNKDNDLKNHRLSKEEIKVYNAIINCRNGNLGFHNTIILLLFNPAELTIE